uniref:Uncharacterized protein n=1 Tax=Laticauda laticaudata TaxID=8630 RepID=A0A8C5WZA4_LATLA
PRVVCNASDASLVFPWAMWAALCSWAAWINCFGGCKCVKVTSIFIRPVKYARVEIFPGGVACRKMEIIGDICWFSKLLKISTTGGKLGRTC